MDLCFSFDFGIATPPAGVTSRVGAAADRVESEVVSWLYVMSISIDSSSPFFALVLMASFLLLLLLVGRTGVRLRLPLTGCGDSSSSCLLVSRSSAAVVAPEEVAAVVRTDTPLL